MNESHSPAPSAHGDDHAGHGPDIKLYMMVFGALAVCTALSFIVNAILGQNLTSAGIIMMVSVIKASLVVAIFMHVKWDWRRVYFIICPLMILATMMIIVLLPDLVFAWQ